MASIYNYLLPLITVTVGILVLSDIEHEKEHLPRKICEVLMSIAVGCGFVIVFSRFFDGIKLPTVGRLSVVIALSVYSLLFSKYRIYTKATLICVYYASNTIMRNLSGLMIQIFGVNTRNSITYGIVSLVLFTAFLALIGAFIRRYRISSTKSASRTFWIAFLFVMVFSEAARIALDAAWERYFLTSDQIRSISDFLSGIIIPAMILLIYYLIYNLATQFSRREELSALQKKQDEIMADVARTNRMYDEIRVLRHEFKNNILTMRVLSRTHQYDKLDRYLDNYLKADGAALSHFDCGNKVLNNIINYKSADLTQKGTEFEINVSVPEELPFAESDLTSLLVNLIDNAAEAAGMTEHPTVALKIIVEKSFCFITVSNTVLGDVLAENPDLLTTKQDKKGHGIGLKVVRSIVSKYDGLIDFTQEGDRFSTSVMLSL